jgi:hypothetical protein
VDASELVHHDKSLTKNYSKKWSSLTNVFKNADIVPICFMKISCRGACCSFPFIILTSSLPFNTLNVHAKHNATASTSWLSWFRFDMWNNISRVIFLKRVFCILNGNLIQNVNANYLQWLRNNQHQLYPCVFNTRAPHGPFIIPRLQASDHPPS